MSFAPKVPTLSLHPYSFVFGQNASLVANQRIPKTKAIASVIVDGSRSCLLLDARAWYCFRKAWLVDVVALVVVAVTIVPFVE